MSQLLRGETIGVYSTVSVAPNQAFMKRLTHQMNLAVFMRFIHTVIIYLISYSPILKELLGYQWAEVQISLPQYPDVRGDAAGI